MIKVAIVDDQPLILRGLGMIVDMQSDMSLLWTAENGEEAIYKSNNMPADVILMDIRMPLCNGVEATKQIKTVHPETFILILTTFMEDEEIFESLKNGASGYLLKDATPEVITDSVRKVINGGTIIEPLVASKLIKHLKPTVEPNQKEHLKLLTSKELDIARAISEGYSNKEVAAQLFISEGTVKNHLTSILEKLALRDRTQLAIFMIKNDQVSS